MIYLCTITNKSNLITKNKKEKMKLTTNLKSVLSVILFAIIFTAFTKAQDMNPPKPVESAYFDKWVGTWVGENVFAGQPGKQTIVAAWDLNHQFLVVNVTGTNDNNPDFKYRGTGYYTIDNSGNYVGYWFDIFGIAGISSSKGKISGDKLEGNVTAEGYTGTEWANITGDVVNMGSKGTFEYNGQKMPFEHTTVYKRK